MTYDKIHIRDLFLRCIIGFNDDERSAKQDVMINITLFTDTGKAGRSDAIEDTADYKAVKKAVIAMVEKSSFNLLERLAEEIADVCLQDRHVERAAVTVDKPGALRFARSVAVEIERKRKH